MILDTLEDDEWMAYLREWYRNRGTGSALTLEEIESLLNNPARPNQDPAQRSEAAPSQAEAFEPDPQPG